MHYLGGKFRTAKIIVEFLNQFDKDLVFYEPFVGGFNIRPHFKLHKASDAHEDLILLYQALQSGWEPPSELSEEDYRFLKDCGPSPLRAFAGFGCSHSGKWFGGYARDPKSDRNYALNARNSLLKKFKDAEGVEFSRKSYVEVRPTGSVIYADPPYANTTKYSMKFDHDEFWDWAEKMVTENGNIVVVSEYAGNGGFVCVKEISTKTDMNTKAGKEPRIERLFMHESQIGMLGNGYCEFCDAKLLPQSIYNVCDACTVQMTQLINEPPAHTLKR